MNKNLTGKILAMATPPPPPPPLPSKSKKSRKPLLIVIIVIVLIVALAVGVYLGTRGNGANTSPNATSTPSAGATSTPKATATTTGIGSNVAGASSLQFSVSVTNSSGGSLGSYTYYVKNAGTSNQMLRIEIADPSGNNMVYIINGALQQIWLESGGQWTDLSSSFSTYWGSWNSQFTGYQNTLAGWSGVGDWTYSDPNGDTVTISNISVNPSLADSLFQHS